MFHAESRWVKGVKPESFSWYHPDLCTIGPNFTSILKIFCSFIWQECFGTYKLGHWICILTSSGTEWSSVGVPHSLPSSLMLWLKVVPSDGIGILPLICACPPRGCTICICDRFTVG
jgi:hypothetical protein